MTKDKIDRDLDSLKKICEALEATTERMRRASLEFAWDKYVLQPQRDKLEITPSTREGSSLN